MDKQDAAAKLSKLVNKATDALQEACAFADKHGLDFHFCPEYGMGGYYDGDEQGWNPSSQSC